MRLRGKYHLLQGLGVRRSNTGVLSLGQDDKPPMCPMALSITVKFIGTKGERFPAILAKFWWLRRGTTVDVYVGVLSPIDFSDATKATKFGLRIGCFVLLMTVFARLQHE